MWGRNVVKQDTFSPNNCDTCVWFDFKQLNPRGNGLSVIVFIRVTAGRSACIVVRCVKNKTKKWYNSAAYIFKSCSSLLCVAACEPPVDLTWTVLRDVFPPFFIAWHGLLQRLLLQSPRHNVFFFFARHYFNRSAPKSDNRNPFYISDTWGCGCVRWLSR